MLSKSEKTESPNSSYAILEKTAFIPGDVLLLDIDQTLLFCKKGEKYTETPLLAHPKLPALLKTLQNQGVICVGLTERKANYAEITQQQLATLGLSFSLAQKLLAHSTFYSTEFSYQQGVFYSPEQQKQDQKISTKGNTALTLLQKLKGLDAFTLEQQGLTQQTLARHLIALDDKVNNLEAIKYSVLPHKDTLGIDAIETHLVCKKPLFVSNSKDATQFPADLSILQFIEHLGGGSGGVYRLKDIHSGIGYTFKAHHDLNHLQEELISDALYQAVGCAVPDFAIISEIPPCLEDYELPRNGVYRLARFIPANKKQDKSFIQKELVQHFLVDALLANWDIAVGDFKNVILDKNNTLYRIDNGGALRYRATQGLKQEDSSWSAHHVGELMTLRDPKKNKDAAEVYKDLTQTDLWQQHQALLKGANRLFSSLNQLADVLPIENIEELHYFIASRLYDLEIRLHPAPHPYAKAFTSLKANKEHNSASILVSTEVKGIPCVLLGKRIRHAWYGDFGGKSELSDGTLFITASREASEETAGKIHLFPAQLELCSSHDLISQKENIWHTHRLFLAQQNYTPSQEFCDAVQKDTTHTQEYTDFEWVPVEALLTAIEHKKTIHEENQETLEVNYTSPETGEEKTISLFPPFAKILQQAPVKDHLQQATVKNHLQKKRHSSVFLPSHRTRSHEETQDACFQGVPTAGKDHVAWGTQEHHEASIKIRTVAYGNQTIEERVYPDPEAEHQTLIKTTVASAPLNQEIKGKTKDIATHLASTRPTQTIAHLQGLLKSDETKPEHLVQQFFAAKMSNSPMVKDLDYQARLIQVVKGESNHPNHIVLYHTTNARIGFFYDLISLLRSTLVFEDLRSLRTFDDVFAGIEDVEAFLLEQCKKQGVSRRQELDNYAADYQEKGLSCNFSVFGNYDHPSSSSFDYFYRNSSATNNEQKVLVNGLAMLLNYLNIQSVSLQELINLYEHYQKDLGAHLYQIFIAEEQVNKLCYFSGFHGRYHDFKQPWQEGMKPESQHQLLPVITALRQDPQAFAENPELKQQESLQVRLYLQPYSMHDSQAVHISTYKNQKNPRLVHQELGVLAQRIAQELLQKKQGLQLSYQASLYGESEMSALQRKYAYIAQGETKQTISYSPYFNIKILYQCIKSGEAAVFERALKSMPEDFDLDQESTDFSGRKKDALLLYAIKEKQFGIVNILLGSKYCTSKFLTQENNAGDTAFMLAAKEGHTEIIKAFLDSKYYTLEFMTRVNNYGQTALIIAAGRGNIDVVNALLDSKGCTQELVTHADNAGETAFMLAAKGGHTEIIKAFLDSKYYTLEFMTRVNKSGQNALLGAACIGCTDIVKALLDSKDCTPELVIYSNNYFRNTALLEAIPGGHIGIVNALLDSKYCTPEFMTHANICGNTALLEAARYGHTDIVNALLGSKYCSPKLVIHANKDGNTVFILAAQEGQADVIQALVDSKYYTPELLTRANNSGGTAVLEAARRGHTGIVKTLVDSKDCSQELVTHANNEGDTAFILAAKEGHADIIKALLDSKYCTPEFMNWANSYGNTALLEAAQEGYTDIVKILLDSKACSQELVTHANNDGETAFTLAALEGRTDIIKEFLNSKYCTPEFMAHRNNSENTAFILAIKGGHTEVVKALLDSKNCTTELLAHTDNDGETALSLAAKKGYSDIIKALVNSEYCTPELMIHVNNNGNTALIEAAQKGYTDIVKALLGGKDCTPDIIRANYYYKQKMHDFLMEISKKNV